MSDYFRVTTKEEVLELLASLPEFLDENGFSEEEKQNCIANYTRLAEISPTEKELLESEWYADMMGRGGVVDTQVVTDEWNADMEQFIWGVDTQDITEEEDDE